MLDKLEHVIANISFSFSTRGDLKLTLISPQGTSSEILSYRKNDRSNKGAYFFPFMTLFNWGESARGTWKLIIESRKNKDESLENYGRLEYFSLVFYGTRNVEKRSSKRFMDYTVKAYIPSEEDVKKIYKRELMQSRTARIIHKRVLENNEDLMNIFEEFENQF